MLTLQSPPGYWWLRLNSVWLQNSGTWTRITAGEDQRDWHTGPAGFPPCWTLSKKTICRVGRDDISLCSECMKCEPRRGKACRGPWRKLSALEESEQMLEAERLLSCDPWLQGHQCRRELLGPTP